MTDGMCRWCGTPLEENRHHPQIAVCDATRDRGCVGCIVRDKEIARLTSALAERDRRIADLLGVAGFASGALTGLFLSMDEGNAQRDKVRYVVDRIDTVLRATAGAKGAR